MLETAQREQPLVLQTPVKEMYPLMKRGDTFTTVEAKGGVLRIGYTRIGKPLSPRSLIVLLHLMDSVGHKISNEKIFQILSPAYDNPPKYYPPTLIFPIISRLKKELSLIDEELPHAISVKRRQGYYFIPHESVANWYGLNIRSIIDTRPAITD